MHLQWALPALQLPYLCNARFLIRCAVLAQAVAVVLAFAPGLQSDNVWGRLGVISVFVHWVMLLTVLCLCVLRRKINRLSPLYILVAANSVFLLITFCISMISYAWLGSFLSEFSHSLSGFTLSNLMVNEGISISGIVSLISQFTCIRSPKRHCSNDIMHTERSEQVSAQGRAELSALQARIQPHFLFNSLNTVAELTQVDAKAAEKALLDLSALFRAALHAGEMVTLRDELLIARQYLSLE
uniref:sensor histidine kinase n=1 Tax=Rheinheimera sp. TaxID=1869214 RepID=UPI0040481DBC